MKKAIFDLKAKQPCIRYCFLLLFLFVTTESFSQNAGKVEVIAPPLFDTLLAKRADLNKGKKGGIAGYASSYGYRVQIFSGSNRTAAYNAQAKCNREFPELRTYIVYHEPNFKVRAGDFRTRIEAERFREQLKDYFPILFIISEKINPPKVSPAND
ncbi:SPOR domain-containing protein [Mucilaginibacter litoreus]|uniref:SPOR domain-containing protein n=1 Tax=Mucilaginibacter litoreus TaxID=1048221 RepID=A0ABW3AUY9_9SPHI